jgi:predicted transposase YbfD/YdcC
MTKSQEGGENEITEDAKREAARTKGNICTILTAWQRDAKAAGDTERVRKIIKAQKYLGCRNIQKREPGQ